MNLLEMRDVSKVYDRRKGGSVRVLDSVSLSVEEGKMVCILGASGVGKTTLLNIIAGLETPSSGTVSIDGALIAPSARKNWFRERTLNTPPVSFVFQHPALLPWRTVIENVALPLQLSGVEREERERRASYALKSVGLADVGESYPHTLSGGMRSRVAIARAMIQNPRLLLMDEPFSSLDPIMRETFDINLMRFTANRKVTSVFVTHSVSEACLLAHEVLVMDRGRFVFRFPVDLPWPRSRETTISEAYLQSVRELRRFLLGTSMAELMPRPRYVKERDVYVDAFERSEEARVEE